MAVDYRQRRRQFNLKENTTAILGKDTSQLNVAVLCCDRHCGENKIALHWRNEEGVSRDYTFEELKVRSEQFSDVLRKQGVGSGDRVAGLLPRIPELVITIIAVWRIGAVYQPLFTAFGPKAIEHRVTTSSAKVIVTDLVNRPKLESAGLSATIVTAIREGETLPAGDVAFNQKVDLSSSNTKPVGRNLDDAFLMMFTSGTTGLPKPLYVSVKALVPFANYMRDAIGLRDDDRFWNLADPGWAYGLYYAVTGPLLLGCATLLYDGPFSVDSAINVIKDNHVNNLAGAPTAYRLMMGAKSKAVHEIKGQLRAVSSAGEPLSPDVISWFSENLDTVIHDHYGQTELGMLLCNYHGLQHEVTPGTAGYAMPGFRLAVVSDEGAELAAGEAGILAVELSGSPLFWFTGYEGISTNLVDEQFYLTGDIAILNRNESIKLVGRADDVITSSGYRIGPFDIESVLIEHEAVVEAAVIGKPDTIRTEIIKAFVVLENNVGTTDSLVEELQAWVKQRLGAHSYPREIDFVDDLPKTPSGKVQRFLLKQR
ncbi:AMP-binding protein [Kineobactrum salinum]|uniref:AMP-binding protein n=1 Tax=Kineobactrum salinum TaxID=2708301 RepID=A0A6C0U3S1_9GAMM|nr:AMP-binding protein [Kineobactrum salinum]QIB66812.1 AMP-binding protein [Kineobactrum salinum]